MGDKIKVVCVNDSSVKEVAMGTSLAEISLTVGRQTVRPYLAAYVNNRFKELHYKIYTPVTVEFIDISHFEGYRVYQRTISFILQKAVGDIWHERRKLHIRHTLGSGFYCEFDDSDELSQTQLESIERRMRSIVEEDIPIIRSRCLTAELRQEYERFGFDDRIALLDTRPRLYSTVHRMGDTAGYFYGSLAPSTGYIRSFALTRYYNGFYVALPRHDDPDDVSSSVQLDKMFDIFHEYQMWIDIMGVPTVGELNGKILAGDGSELIKIAEAFHENKIAAIAASIQQANSSQGTRMVLISGPSSSGKTTFSKRLGIQLRILGLDPVLISLDDYFVERDKTPRDASGEYDFEALEAIDLETLNDHLARLFDGRSVEIPRYDFISGKRQWHDKPLALNDRSILIMEGIHGLNPRLTPSIPDAAKFKIYISFFFLVIRRTPRCTPSPYTPLFRSVERDNSTRGYKALPTLQRWPSVRRGEERHIFPYQENADVMFNSSLFYEISVLRAKAEPILREVPDTDPEYAEARRLLKFLDNFIPVEPDEIPPTSLLREFIGGSSFKY